MKPSEMFHKRLQEETNRELEASSEARRLLGVEAKPEPIRINQLPIADVTTDWAIRTRLELWQRDVAKQRRERLMKFWRHVIEEEEGETQV